MTRFAKPTTGADRRRARAAEMLQRGEHVIAVSKLTGLGLGVVERIADEIEAAERHAVKREAELREQHGVEAS